MAVYTVKIRARKRPQKSVVKRRLKGLALAKAKSALKHLQIMLRHDAGLMTRNENVPATSLILQGDEDATAKVVAVVARLQEAINDSVNIITG